MKVSRNYLILCITILLFSLAASAQRFTGSLRGTVQDPSGAVVSGVTVVATNESTGVASTTTTTSAGEYVFPDLPVGPYTVTVRPTRGLQKFERRHVQVLPNQVVTADAKLGVATAGTTVEVTAGAEAVQTTTSQLTNDFSGRAVTDLPNPGISGSGSPYELAVLVPNTTTQGGGVLGEGGSIGGTRPRMNSFSIDGVDDNRVDVTGHTTDVIPEAVADFNLITNMFNAEQSHSAGGQFNIITKSGTNTWHGSAWEYNNNRDFNARDNLEKASGLSEPRRIDRNRFGADIGGPIIKDKLFVYGAYQFNNIGLAAASVAQLAPTAEGLALLNGMAANDAVRNILRQFPTAAAADSPPEVVNGVPIPVGTFQPSAPSFSTSHDFNTNVDLNVAKHQIRGRFLYDRTRQPNVNPATPLPQFTGTLNADTRKVIFTDAWTISDRVLNDFRASYSRFVQAFTVPSEFANFPNAEIDTLGLNIGPEGNSPQSYIQNNYQVSDNISIVAGKHSIKFGPEYLWWIAPSNFLPRERGEWDYTNLQQFINDQIPVGLNGALRGAGSGVFDGNQHAIFGFIQDDWKVTPRLTLNLGLRYEWYSIANGEKLQTLNAISNAPFTLPYPCIENLPCGGYIFRVPKSDKNNFMPRVGFAFDPTGAGKWAIRGGFGISYDVIPQNFPLLSLPPQLQTEQSPDVTCSGASGPPPAWCATGVGFLAGGGLLQVNVPPSTVADARSATQGIMLDHVMPKVLTWTLGVQREIARDTILEVRYLGTRATQLPIQAQTNRVSAFTAGLQPLPTFLNAGQVPAVITGGPRLSDFENFKANKRYLINPDFSTLTTIPSLGGSIYHAASVDLNRRFTRGLMIRANYTWSHTIDDSTNELFSSLVNPRRPEDWMRLILDRGNSVLDVRHKFALSWVYDLPKVATDNGFLKALLHGWEYTGTYLAQSGQPISILSGVDSNGNNDAAGDRGILNPAGIPGTSSDVNLVCVGAGGATSIAASCPGGSANVAGYVAQNPNARYIIAQLGAFPTIGRNTFRAPGLNLWNMGLLKNTSITERASLQFRVSVFNIFNHRSFSLGQPTVFQTGSGGIIGTVNNALSTTYANIGSDLFLNAHQFTGSARQMQLGVKLLW
ncbi:MAG: TonB-dependent receptor domain-containing protein [Terriglobales bacterium]